MPDRPNATGPDPDGPNPDGPNPDGLDAALDEYRERRDFGRTPEPPPATDAAAGEARTAGPLTFVVQKHDATRLHYDLRLEIDGAMHSWPVPNGPSLDPADRRLAVMTEPHPLGYAAFEGVIPPGEYGAGEVIVWDHGTYSPDTHGQTGPPRQTRRGAPGASDAAGPGAQYDFDDPVRASERMREQLERGKISVTLRGERMRGSYTLVRTTQSDNSWLLIKHRDGAAQAGGDLAPRHADSVRSGLTIADLQAGRRPTPRADLVPASLGALDGAVSAPPPRSMTPMQARLTEAPFDAEDWWFEPKADGIRVLAFVERGRVTLRSRRGVDITEGYPELVRAFAAQPVSTAVFDGEIVAFGPEGTPSFAALERRMSAHDRETVARVAAEAPVACLLFDLPYLDGFGLLDAPWYQRRETLRRVVMPDAALHLIDGFPGTGLAAYEAALAVGFEGVVAKHRSGRYRPGTRSARWLKIKARRSGDFVVGGFTAGQGARGATFGSLLLGSYDDSERAADAVDAVDAADGGETGEAGASGGLRFVGAVGSGFDDRALASLRARLEALGPAELPFLDPAPDSPALQPGVTYVRPELVVEVAYTQRTPHGHLRDPVFLRLREDKAAADAHVEMPVAVPSPITPRTTTPAEERAGGEPPAERAVEGGGAPAWAANGVVASVLEQLDRAGEEAELVVGGERLQVGSLDKVFWPEAHGQRALTKRDLLRYYARVAPVLLPHLRDRALTLTRYPNGVAGESFYQKHVEHAPEFVERIAVHSASRGGAQELLLCNNLPTLLWLGQLADLALHTSLARVVGGADAPGAGTAFAASRAEVEASVLNRPDVLLFDLDPYIYAGDEAAGAEPELNRRGWRATCEAARWLRDLLDTAGLSAYLKTSGATGLHIYVPIVRNLTYPEVRSVAETFAAFLLRAHPRELTTEWSVERRTGRVFVDVNQNARIKNLAAPYSPRAKPGAPVSTPLRWSELDDVYPTDFTMLTVPERIDELGDLWSSIGSAQQDITALIGSQ